MMWVFPLVAALIALAFAGVLARRYPDRRRPHEALWAVALLMYAAASFMVVLGVLGDWSAFEYRTYWLLGAALNVPFLAAGEVVLLFRRPWVLVVVLLALVFVTGYSFAVVRTAGIADPAAFAEDLPSGKVVFGAGTAAQRLPQVIAYPAYFLLLGGTLWSAWQMRGRPERRDAFYGVLGIAFGATIVAAVGSAFAAAGNFTVFSLALTVGIAVMFWGFLRTSRHAVDRAPAPSSAS
ncbi:MAG TPA: hypothetical protein VGA74_00195 [Actinomycetota bacterium]